MQCTDLLGKSIEDTFDMCDRRFCVKTVAILAIGMIKRIQSVHQHNLVYRGAHETEVTAAAAHARADIKPDKCASARPAGSPADMLRSFMLGIPRSLQANDVFIIDFGMAKLFRDRARSK